MTGTHTTADLIAIVQQAVQPLNENINMLRLNFSEVATNLMKKDEVQQAEIDKLRKDFDGREGVLTEICTRIGKIEETLMSFAAVIPQAVELGVLQNRISRTERENGELNERLEGVEKWVPFIKTLRWVVGILLTLMLGTIWMLITGVQSITNIAP